ncbi:hypothetical protein AC481_02400 [miscellaneous Crenarchaeota group archaeon SMTZ-80]|nr:MAG: hypothetical protein AC481_02400 [miscellaneous Crenarchaeota group archaeon SMTZ-80]
MHLEDEILLHLAFGSSNKSSPQRIKNIDKDLDWRYFIGRAIHYRIVPIIYHNLHKKIFKKLRKFIPEEVHDALKKLNYSFIGHSIALHNEASEIFESLKSKGIIFMPIKGIVVSDAIYPKRYLRFFSDIDILFPNIFERKKAERTIEKLGYNLILPDPLKVTLTKFKHGLSFECDVQSSFSIFPFFSYPPEIESIWEKISEIKSAKRKIRILSNEHMLIILCLHSIRNRSLSLVDIIDASHIINNKPNFNWQFISKQIKKYPCILGIPLGIIYSISNRLADRGLICESSLTELKEISIVSKTSLILSEKVIKITQYPIFYKEICLKCKFYRKCPFFRYLSFEAYNESNIRFMHLFRRILFELYFITSIVRWRFGIKYALKCFIQEILGILNSILRKSKIKIFRHHFLKPIMYLERKSTNLI